MTVLLIDTLARPPCETGEAFSNLMTNESATMGSSCARYDAAGDRLSVAFSGTGA